MPQHLCHWPGCKIEVAPRLWGCPQHWKMLPTSLRCKLLRAYIPGQEISKRPSEKYIALALEVQKYIEENHRDNNY